MRGLVLIAALLCAAPAQAQDQAPRMEALIAQTAIAALPETGSATRAYRWDAFIARMSPVTWHFDAAFETHQRGHFLQRGYLTVPGEQADVVACGIETQAMAFAVELSSFSFEHEDWGSLVLEALRAAGADVRARGAMQYDVTAPGRDGEMQLRIAEECTSPMSAAAQRCWTSIVFTLPSLNIEKRGGEEASQCSASRRYYSALPR